MAGHATRTLLLAGAACAPLLAAAPARAQVTDSRMNAIEAQIQALQDELAHVRRDLKAAQARTAQEARNAAASAAQARQSVQMARAPAAGGTSQMAAQGSAPSDGASSGAPQMGLQQTASGQGGAGGSQGGAGGSQGGAGGTQGSSPTGGQGAQVVQQQSGQASGPLGTFKLGGVTVQLGGFIEAAGIARSRNETADIASSFSGIPELNTQAAHESEFRESSHQSRISLLATANVDPVEKLAAYFETDFQGTGPSSNSNESNSYNLRLRQAYATYDNSELGLHGLGGQAWSLLTMFRTGLDPRQENVPLTIDAQYVVGFNWARQAQFRIAKDFDSQKYWLAASLEEPQGVYSVGPNGAGTVGGTANTSNAGGSGLNATTTYSDDIAPDIVLKAAADPGWGHYEVYGLGRFLHDRVSVVGAGTSNTRLAGGGGAAALLPIIPKVLEVQGSFLAGAGIGRYGSGQLPDATLSASGRPVPLPEIQALVGVIGHPIPTVDIYGYGGLEEILGRSDFAAGGKGYGYGSPLYSNAGCGIELSTASCTANTSALVEGTVGAWWRFLHSSYGTMQVGAQYEYVKRSIFSGVGGSKGTDDNIALVSFRYAPFQ